MAVGKKYGGRAAGTPNKVTYLTREKFKEIVEGEVSSGEIRERLNRLSDKDYFAVILKMAEFYTPKYQSIAVNVENAKSDLMVKLIALRDDNAAGERRD